MGFNIHLAVESTSCKGIHALRAAFAISILRDFVYSKSNESLLSRILSQVAAKQAPFDMVFCGLHRTRSPRTAKQAVRYRLQSNELYHLRDNLREQLADAKVFKNSAHPGSHNIITLRENFLLGPRAYARPFNVPIRNRIDGDEETNKILQEVSKIDPRTLDNLRAVGFRLRGQRGSGGPEEDGELIPFLGRS